MAQWITRMTRNWS